MAQPTVYNRQYNFSNYQTLNPSVPLPATQVDAELNAVKTTLDQTLSNLVLLQRDDGALQTGTVGYAQLKPELTTGVNPASLWALGQSYMVNSSSVFYSNKLYICTASHVSTNVNRPDQVAAPWSLLADFSSVTIADGSITTAKLADGSVTSAKLATTSIATANLIDGSVSTAKIADAGITTAKIADNNVTTAKLAALGSTRRVLGSNASTAVSEMILGNSFSISGSTIDTLLPTITLLTSGTGTFTPQATTRFMRVRVVGGGGAGGGAPSTAGGQGSAGASGSAGGYIEHIYTSIAGSYSYTVGGGGTAVSGGTGGNGSATTFGSLSAPGGFGGTTGAAGTNSLATPPGTSAPTGGNVLNVSGPCGSGSFYSQTASIYQVGNGANGPWGGGGLGPVQNTAGNSGIVNTGGGGSGTANAASQAARTGGNGGSGVIIVEEFAS